MIKLAVLGSTGSVGTQTLEVVEKFPDEIEVVALLAKRASEKLLDQAIRYRPPIVVTYEEPSREWLSSLPEGTEYMFGDEGLRKAISLADRVMNAVSGIHGIKPAYYALKEKKTLLASNKESIVCLGDFVRENRDRIIPVDSEHNALFQLLEGVRREDIRFLYLTASGGPFRKWSLDEMKKATPEDALKHPNWNMGAKITIDSATLMNKGFEMLEAMNLFDVELSRIKVVIHPQSVVHGVLELKDGSFFLHAGKTDMRIPIMHALFYPERKEYPFGRVDLTFLSPVEFEPVDEEKFRSLYLARWAGEMRGVYIPVLVGADEEAVSLFLEGILEAIEWARRKVRKIYEESLLKT